LGAVHPLSRTGVGVEELMERFDRSRSSIYRIINKYRATRLLVRKVGYVESLEFESEEAQGRIPAIADLNERGETKGVVLSREQERVLFRRYNFVKYLACVRLEGLDVERCSSRAVGEIEGWLDESEEIKKVIIEANLGLVASIASKHSRGGVGMSDLVSEGSLSLMRAVEKFDYTRGYRFSTYATWAITKDFARKIPEEARHRERTGGGGDMSNVEEDMRIGEAVDFGAIERAGHSLDEVIRNNLTEREAYIIRNHYALGAGVVRKKPKTLKQIGSDLGLSSERIRQIELEALQKLRQNLSAEEFDLLTG
jgi:RNA polymerase sigma factor (sigma-70 family)